MDNGPLKAAKAAKAAKGDWLDLRLKNIDLYLFLLSYGNVTVIKRKQLKTILYFLYLIDIVYNSFA